MTIPLWLPWVILIAVVAAALPRPDSPWRAWGPAVVALVAAVWLTVGHALVTQDELNEATAAAGDAVDGALGGVTSDRMRIEIEDRLGRPVAIEQITVPSADPTAIAYAFLVTRSPGDDSPATCVHVVERRVQRDTPGLGLASVTTDNEACSTSNRRTS